MRQAHSFWISSQQFKMLHLDIHTNYSVVCNVLVCMPSRGILLMRQSVVQLCTGGLPDLDQGIIELRDSMRFNLAALKGLKHNVPEFFCWIYLRQTVGGSQWYQLFHPPVTACILSLHEARHCRAAGGIKDLFGQWLIMCSRNSSWYLIAVRVPLPSL